MSHLTGHIKRIIQQPHSFIFTVDRTGRPSMSSRGTVAILDDHRIVFADLYACRNQDDVKNDRREVSVSVVNTAAYAGCRIRGRARVIPRGTEYDRITRIAGGAGQLAEPGAGYAVEVEVRAAEII